MPAFDTTFTRLPRTDLVTLDFEELELEKKFRADYVLRIRCQSRYALLLGAFLYMAFAVLDAWTTPETQELFLILRLSIVAVIMAAFFFSFSIHFLRFHQLIMALATAIAGAGIVAMVGCASPESSARYYVGLILVNVFTCTLSGLRYFSSLLVSVLLLVAYTMVATRFTTIELPVLVSNEFFLVSSTLLAVAAGFTMERYRRTMFFQTLLIDKERRINENHALHDSLTGLPNRAQFDRLLRRTMLRAQRYDTPFALLFVDIDNFKPINDTYGHHVGDVVLKEIAHRLKLCLRETDAIARLGGDEFLILVEDLQHREGIEVVSERILELLGRPFTISGKGGSSEITISTVSASIGISIFPADAESLEVLVRRADAAMYRAKKTGRGGYCFSGHPY